MKFLKNKRNIILLILVFFSTIALIFTNNNYSFYKDEIVKVTDIKIKQTDESSNSLGLTEKYYTETITGTIMNGKSKGNKIKLVNEYTYSSVVTEKYKIGDKVFIDMGEIKGLKRDFYVVLMIVIFVIMMFLVGSFRGLGAIVSVIINTALFYFGLELYFKGMNLLVLCLLESIIFTIFSLIISNGKNKKTLAAIISVFISMFILLVMTLIIVLITDYSGISFNEMSFITVPVEDVFIAELMIGGLGAIMDVSITMSSSIAELVEQNNKITIKELKKSGKEIGKDIMGTMINVLFFTYLCSGLPLFVLALRNGFSLYNYINTNVSLEMARFLIGSIGIVLTIPISLFIAIKVLKRSDNNE